MIADHFGRERRGFALALNAAAGNLGTLVVPLVAALLIVGFGWRRTLMLFAIPMVVVGLIVIGFAHDPGSPAAQKAQGSRRLGLMVSETKDLLKNPTVAFLIIASLVSAGGRGLGIVLNFIPAYLGDPDKGLGLPTETVGWIYMILLIGSVLGPLALGRLSDKLGARKPVIVAVYAASAIAVLILVGFNPVGWLLQLVILFFGFVVFSESSLIQSFMSDAVPAGARDIMFGTYFAAGFGISALWVVLQGWLVDHYGFAAMFIAMAGSYVVAALFVLGAREHGGAGSPHPAS
jgi:MFS family permease